MTAIELIILSIGLAMDAFAVAITLGLTMAKFNFNKAIIVGLYFGIFQAAMPVVGFAAGAFFAHSVAAYSHIIAFVLLAFLGIKMIWGSFKKDNETKEEASLSLLAMLPLAIATSIDAMAVGVSLAFLQVRLLLAVVTIGLITFIIACFGVKVGNVFGTKYKDKAEIAGGVVLILIGLHILHS